MRKTAIQTWVLGLVCWAACVSSWAALRLPAIFSDHMVLQKGQVVPVWGWAEPGEPVAVSMAGRTWKAVTGPDGKWRVTLDALDSGEPLTLTVKGNGTHTIVVQDVLVGEVWLCSGQSNMEMGVGGVRDANQEMAAAKFPAIRTFRVQHQANPAPQEECAGEWKVCSPNTVGQFSAAAYFLYSDFSLANTLGGGL